MTTARPLRQDAARNRERLVLAAREVFRKKGVAAPLEEIAREAGLAIGTLYNRFPSRDELVEAALCPLAQQAVDEAEQAASLGDPWQAFATYLENTCALFAAARAYADIYRYQVPPTPGIAAAQRRLFAIKAEIMARAKEAGVLRADVKSADIAIMVWSVAGAIDATREIAPDAWRRHLALLLDGLRPEGAHPLPVPPLTARQLRNAAPG